MKKHFALILIQISLGLAGYWLVVNLFPETSKTFAVAIVVQSQVILYLFAIRRRRVDPNGNDQQSDLEVSLPEQPNLRQ